MFYKYFQSFHIILSRPENDLYSSSQLCCGASLSMQKSGRECIINPRVGFRENAPKVE
jgi:hypothetical protein